MLAERSNQAENASAGPLTRPAGTQRMNLWTNRYFSALTRSTPPTAPPRLPVMITCNPPSENVAAKRRGRSGARAMTLVEVMIVVVIVGVLSTLAIYGVTRYIRSAQSSEAYAVINAIRGAQDVYRQDTMKYLDVSAGSYDNTHPSGTPGAFKTAWVGGTSATAAGFRELGVELDSATYFTFACVAVNAGEGIPSPPTEKKDFGFSEQVSEPAYVVVAKGNIDGDAVFSYLLSHNLTNEIYVENEGE